MLRECANWVEQDPRYHGEVDGWHHDLRAWAKWLEDNA